MLIVRQMYNNDKIILTFSDNFNIVKITKYINITIKPSLFMSSREIMGKYVTLCDMTVNKIIKTMRFFTFWLETDLGQTRDVLKTNLLRS